MIYPVAGSAGSAWAEALQLTELRTRSPMYHVDIEQIAERDVPRRWILMVPAGLPLMPMTVTSGQRATNRTVTPSRGGLSSPGPPGSRLRRNHNLKLPAGHEVHRAWFAGAAGDQECLSDRSPPCRRRRRGCRRCVMSAGAARSNSTARTAACSMRWVPRVRRQTTRRPPPLRCHRRSAADPSEKHRADSGRMDRDTPGWRSIR
jgi:hypothetical protein